MSELQELMPQAKTVPIQNVFRMLFIILNKECVFLNPRALAQALLVFDRALRLPVSAWAFTSLRSKDCKTRHRIFQFWAFELTMHVICGQR